MYKSTFEIPRMDCPSEENMIRMQLSELPGIKHLDFDIAGRSLTVYHEDEAAPIVQALDVLDLGSRLKRTEKSAQTSFETHEEQRRLLWIVLLINFVFFMIEMGAGWMAQSMGLVADSLDMLADASVYGISLLAVGATMGRKKKVARMAGYFQIFLAVLGFFEVLHRFLGVEPMPDFKTMMLVSFLALFANAYSLYLLQGAQSKEEAHMQASLIFTSNDIIINLGVILAAVLVYYTHSGIPDLLIGAIVFIIVLRGAWRILKLGQN